MRRMSGSAHLLEDRRQKDFSPPERIKYHCRECNVVAMMILRDDRSAKQDRGFEK